MNARNDSHLHNPMRIRMRLFGCDLVLICLSFKINYLLAVCQDRVIRIGVLPSMYINSDTPKICSEIT